MTENFVNRSKMLSTLTLKQMTMAMTAMMMALDPPMTQSQAVNREQCSTSCVLQGTSDLFLGYLKKNFSLRIKRIHFKAKSMKYCPILVNFGPKATDFKLFVFTRDRISCEKNHLMLLSF